MQKRLIWLPIFLVTLAGFLTAQEHAAIGIVVSADPTHHSLTISFAAIPGYMAAMEMPFIVQESKYLAALKPGTADNLHNGGTRKELLRREHPD